MNRYQIKDELGKIFEQRFGIPEKMFCQMDETKDLLAREYNFGYREMIYLLYDIERVFLIKVPDQDLLSGRYGSLKNIIEIIYEQLQIKGTEKI